uniref:Uncharacterized protein n=1 Tax=Oryza glaberrima TaxID=4538 RepID=I1QZE7_ORYGL
KTNKKNGARCCGGARCHRLRAALLTFIITQKIQTDRSHIEVFTQRGWQEFLNAHTTISYQCKRIGGERGTLHTGDRSGDRRARDGSHGDRPHRRGRKGGGAGGREVGEASTARSVSQRPDPCPGGRLGGCRRWSSSLSLELGAGDPELLDAGGRGWRWPPPIGDGGRGAASHLLLASARRRALLTAATHR